MSCRCGDSIGSAAISYIPFLFNKLEGLAHIQSFQAAQQAGQGGQHAGMMTRGTGAQAALDRRANMGMGMGMGMGGQANTNRLSDSVAIELGEASLQMLS